MISAGVGQLAEIKRPKVKKGFVLLMRDDERLPETLASLHCAPSIGADRMKPAASPGVLSPSG